MLFPYSSRATSLLVRLTEYVDDVVLPAESAYLAEVRGSRAARLLPQTMETLREEARRRGLWALYLGEDGRRWSAVDYCGIDEVLGRSLLGPFAVNSGSPDAGIADVLASAGSQRVREEWLPQLREGTVSASLSLTEPDSSSADPTQIQTTVRREGHELVVSGRKWFSGGIPRERCKFVLVMALSDPAGERHRRHSLVLVPLDAPGVTVVRSLPIFGYDAGELGHPWAEVLYEDVRVPVNSLVGEWSRGFELIQEELAGGRLHMAMRSVGMAERALAAMRERSKVRAPFGKPLSEQGSIRKWIVDARLGIQQARLMALAAADRLDREGARAARAELSMAKLAATRTAVWTLDHAIQVHGAAGVTGDFFLATAYARMRGAQIAEGPDEVHKMVIARRELRPFEGAVDA